MPSLVGVLIGYIICGFALNFGTTSTLVALSKPQLPTSSRFKASTLTNLCTVATATPLDQAPALSCLHLFRSLGSEIGLALSGAIVQQVLRYSLHATLNPLDNPYPDLDIDALVDQVRKSLEFLDQLDPPLKHIVRTCYSVAVRWCLIFCVVLAVGGLLTGLWVGEGEGKLSLGPRKGAVRARGGSVGRREEGREVDGNVVDPNPRSSNGEAR